MTTRVAAIVLSMVFMTAAVPISTAWGGQGPAHSGPLMTEQERQAFLDRLKQAKTPAERERIEAEHRAFIRQRLLERGAELPGDDDGNRSHATDGTGKSRSKQN